MNAARKFHRFGPWLARAGAILLIVSLGYALLPWVRPAPALPPAFAVAMPPQAAQTPTPPPTRATPSPMPSHGRASPGVTPPPGSAMISLTPAPEGIGWASDLNGKLQLSPPGVHVGFLSGYGYLAALQFDLAALPPDSIITQASLELTGLDATYLTQAAAWQVALLPPTADAAWPALSYTTLRDAAGQGVATATLEAGELGPGKANAFAFGPEMLAALQARAGGTAVWRLTGPSSGSDNLFTWDSGYRLRGELETRPVLRIILAPGASYVIVTSMPTPENIVTVAAMALRATEIARTIGTYTPVPRQWVTPVIVTPQPAPGNAATATFQAAVAAAEAFLFGTPTPTPPNLWTTTPTPPAITSQPGAPAPTLPATLTPTRTATPVFVLLQGQLPPLPPTRTPPPTPLPMPRPLIGKIAFLSDRASLAADPSAPPLSNPLVYVINPDGTGLALLTDRWPYDQALKRDPLSADQRYRAFVKDVEREDGKLPVVFYFDSLYNTERLVTTFGRGIAYDPVWSPAADRIALISNDSGNDEIWVINRDGSDARQLTRDPYNWWDKRPSWSPDGKQIVFWSNRSGRRQIWIMDADGQNLHTLSLTDFNDWDPVWIKYQDPPRYGFQP